MPLSGPAPATPTWEPLRPPLPSAWTGPAISIIVGPVYFLYGGASVWTLVR
jgi:hypothetical protein